MWMWTYLYVYLGSPTNFNSHNHHVNSINLIGENDSASDRLLVYNAFMLHSFTLRPPLTKLLLLRFSSRLNCVLCRRTERISFVTYLFALLVSCMSLCHSLSLSSVFVLSLRSNGANVDGPSEPEAQSAIVFVRFEHVYNIRHKPPPPPGGQPDQNTSHSSGYCE